ncbi:Metacaspase-1 [Seminavis robusta]|uniref:Metacaspase-1 n=1 Tax=Seminavis robusta TaxID=568900 RepID=A0A9N8DW21_9STRA|nr:Metacaspase-1 [Seminavis robusta]|eukprot:Sro400_g135070.1 Metacaspase-1 (328) ;mRNA; f:23048-24481
MGRFFKKLISKVERKISNPRDAQAMFEEKKPDAMKNDIRMISGCEDAQTSADVSNVGAFKLPDPAGRAGGACTSTLLSILYKDEKVPEDDLSFTEVLTAMRENLKKSGFSQIPQLTASGPIDVNTDFDLVPKTATGTKRAVMVGINYVGHSPGELRGCHNDVGNMKRYIMEVHGFEEENIHVLMDDGKHEEPTMENMLNAYKKVVAESGDGDAVFLHYSGHGTKLRDDDDGEEADGYDEALVPLDYKEKGMIRDDDLYDILVKPLKHGVHMVALMDCCHSGTIMDLPYIFRADGSDQQMHLDESLDLDGLFEAFGGVAVGILSSIFK